MFESETAKLNTVMVKEIAVESGQNYLFFIEIVIIVKVISNIRKYYKTQRS